MDQQEMQWGTGEKKAQGIGVSPNESTEVQLTVSLEFLVLFLGECVPNTTCLVTRAPVTMVPPPPRGAYIIYTSIDQL